MPWTRTATQGPGIKLYCGVVLRISGMVSLWNLTSFSDKRKLNRMGQAERPTCPHCGAFMILAPSPHGQGQPTFQCLECDGLDPLKTDSAMGWLQWAG